MLGCALSMTACASVRQETPLSLYECPAPEAYPEEPGLADLIYALSDTYLAWEECRDNMEALKARDQ